VTEAELNALARTPAERVRGALAEVGGDPVATYVGIEEMWRGFLGLLGDWAALTVEWLIREGGAVPAAAAIAPELTGGLAVRRGVAREGMALIEAMLAGPDHPLSQPPQWERALETMEVARAVRIDHVNELLGLAHRGYGDDGLQAVLLHAAERGFWHDWLPGQAGMAPEELIVETAFFLTCGAGCRIRLSEEADRYVVEFLECHCGRQIRDARAGGWTLPVVTGPSPLTYGQPEMTAYQTHFAVIHGMWAIDAAGAPTPPFDCLGTRGAGGGCRNYVYKAAVPERYFAALGRSPRAYARHRSGRGGS
jgi:hypothetical protein